MAVSALSHDLNYFSLRQKLLPGLLCEVKEIPVQENC